MTELQTYEEFVDTELGRMLLESADEAFDDQDVEEGLDDLATVLALTKGVSYDGRKLLNILSKHDELIRQHLSEISEKKKKYFLDYGVLLEKPKPVRSVSVPHKERFIPVSRSAILERLCQEGVWEPGEKKAAKLFLDYLGAWRHHEYRARLQKLEESYLPFNPDRDTFRIEEYSREEMRALQNSLTNSLTDLLIHVNYERITEDTINEWFGAKSPYGFNLKVDWSDFDEVLVFADGHGAVRFEIRTWKNFFFGKEQFEIPIFERIFLLIKVKPEKQRVREIMEQAQVDEKKAEKIVRKIRKNLPYRVSSDYIYLKLFKSIYQTDLGMLFPNTKVEFTLFDRIMSFFNPRTKYMMELAEYFYSNNLANNHGVLTFLVARAEEENIKEEMLLYTYLAQTDIPRKHLVKAKEAIEQLLMSEFHVSVNYNIEDALGRMMRDGLVTEMADGWLRPLRPDDACERVVNLWRGRDRSVDPVLALVRELAS